MQSARGELGSGLGFSLSRRSKDMQLDRRVADKRANMRQSRFSEAELLKETDGPLNGDRRERPTRADRCASQQADRRVDRRAYAKLSRIWADLLARYLQVCHSVWEHYKRQSFKPSLGLSKRKKKKGEATITQLRKEKRRRRLRRWDP